ncbi:MAG: cbb3-type cytochrome c oxidase subunit I [Deltaproteobacteria bacterium]|nr:cbb3-type cytochrome c oxidase subunit I [Deltaproteobacteria bacterium]
MSKITVWFIKSAMVYFMLAVILGLHMAVSGAQYPYMPIHAHFNLLGWISMMIYGVGYHILPRFSGKPLYSERIAEWQFWLANIGLVGMTLGWIVRSWQGGSRMLLIFSIVEAVSSVMFVVNMFKTIKAAPALQVAK